MLVRVRFFTSREGGRRAPVHSGYRAIAAFGERLHGVPVMHDVELQLLEQQSLELGIQVRAKLLPFSPEVWPAREVGQRIRIHEGPAHVGDAYVEEVHL